LGLKHELERARVLEREIRRGVLGRLEALSA
jgi:hypothetical protein